jgi:hypothetical protein
MKINEVSYRDGSNGFRRVGYNKMYNAFLLSFSKDIFINLQKILGLDYRDIKTETAARVFSNMISGYYEEEDFQGIIYNHDYYKFNTSNFVCQSNQDLAEKVCYHKLSIDDKVKVMVIFNDIKERLIAA